MTRNDSPVRALRARLGALRRRIHTLLALQGLGRWIAALVGLLVLYFLADWLLDLPLGVRRFVRLGVLDRPEEMAFVSWALVLVLALVLAVWATRNRLGAAPLLAFLAAGLAGLAAWLGWRFLGPTGLRFTDEELALSVERTYRTLGDRLAAALDFDEQLRHPTRGESAAMMQQVVAQAAEETRELEFAGAISGRRAIRWIGGALVAVLVAGGLAFAGGDTVGLWAQRALLLQDRPWPRRTRIHAVDLLEDGTWKDHEPQQPYEVAVGRPLLVHAFVRGRVPDEALLIDSVQGSRAIPRRLFAVPDSPGLYAVEIRDIRQAFEFVLHAGDDTDEVPTYRVETVVPPRLLSIRTTLAFPAYLERETEEVDGGNATVPDGTRVAVEVVADQGVETARLITPDASLDGKAIDAAGLRFAFDLVAEATIRYRIQLVTANGRESDPAADSYEIRVEPDRPPRVRWIYPEGALDLTPKARVPLLAVAEDDYGVEKLELQVRLPGDVTIAFDLRPADGGAGGEDTVAATDGPLGRDEVFVYHPLDIPSLRDPEGAAPVAPSRLAVRIVATDSKGQVLEGPWTHLDLFVPLDLEHSLGSRRTAVRAAFELLLKEQRTRREQLEAAGRGPIAESERDALRSIQFAQAKLAQDLDEATRDLVRLFNAWIMNRIGAEGPVEKILAIFDRHHRRTYGRATPNEDPASAPAIETGDPVFPYALYDEIVRARNAREIFDTGLVERMLRVIEPAVEAAARRAPVAHDLVRRAAAGEATIEDALAAQDLLIASLEETLEGMSSWKRLNDVILHLRRVIDQQRALDERLEGRPR